VRDPVESSGAILVQRMSRWRRIVLGWDPLEWSVVDRSLLVCALMLPFSVGYWILDELVVRNHALAPYYDFAFLAGFQRVLLGYVIGWAALIAAGVWLRKRPWPAAETVHVWLAIQLYSWGNAIGAVCAGPVTTPHVIVLVGGVAVGFFLFEPAVVIAGMTAATSIIFAGFVANALGWMPYAPLLASAPYVDGKASAWWIGHEALVAAASCAALVTLFAYLTTRLRDRERRLHDAARTDPLTGVANRRRFLEVFTREFERARRYGTPLACVILDLDHFKQINDRYGHIVGDRVLVAAAHAFKGSLRAPDTIARWGGEEFVVLLPQTDLTGAESLAERCRRSLEDVLVTAAGGERVSVTVSVGVAGYPAPAFDSPDALLKSADDALYRAKSAGRNRVVTIPPPVA
jgi:diguanylate cyclase (GGDEF)-like protein